MCPFRITWCIAPEGDPGEVRARDREGLGPPVCCHDQGLEEPPLSIRNSLVSESNPRCARDPGHIQALGRGSLPVPLWRSFPHFSERTVVPAPRTPAPGRVDLAAWAVTGYGNRSA